MFEAIKKIEEILKTAVPEITPNGAIHRFGRNKNCWAVLNTDGVSYWGACGNWKTGLSQKFSTGQNSKLSRYQQRRLTSLINAHQLAHQLQKQRDQEETAKRAANLWGRFDAATTTSYTQLKNVRPRGAKQTGDWLVMPLVDVYSKIWSLQYIAGNGKKTFMKGGRKQGCFIPIQWPANTSEIYICEGWATGCSLADMLPHCAILAACDAGNLSHVALVIRDTHPSCQITIAADVDEVGLRKAIETATLIGGKVIAPNFPESAPLEATDFNDLANLKSGGLK